MTCFVLGIDGGCFEIAREWIEDCDLPNLKKLCKEGVVSDMQSCLPPVTSPNWKCYSTGKNPGKLGVFWWERVKRDENEIINTSQAGQYDGLDFWQLLDKKIAILNLPTSYPPQEVNGIMVAGGPGSQGSGFAYPDSLSTELKEKYGYKVRPDKVADLSREGPNSGASIEIKNLIQKRLRIAKDLLDSGNYDFIHLTVFYVNVLQHYFWDHEVTKQCWKIIDNGIGEILESEELNHLFVMSDHGSNEIKTQFYVNAWLEDEGYLVTRRSFADLLHRFGITQDLAISVLDTFNLRGMAKEFVPESVKNAVPDSEGRVRQSGKENLIDWGQSKAVASGQGPLYILSDKEEREELRDELKSKLSGLRDKDGNSILKGVYRSEEVYSGPYLEVAPDLLLDQASGVHIDGSIGKDYAFDEPNKWSGENKDIGMFIAHGPMIDPDTSLNDMHILDIAPTILHLFGKRIPEEMDGSPRKEIFKKGSEPATRKITKRNLDETRKDTTKQRGKEEVTKRLKDLGYI